MKYWIGYLVAAVFAAITWALNQFAAAHQMLVDMIYPYVSRMIVTTLADWNAGGSPVYQALLLWGILILVVTAVLMFIFKWNFFQWLGWVLATISCVVLLNTGIYGLNAYASPLADDMSLAITDYTVSELNEAAVYFRDQANELAKQVSRDGNGDTEFGTFEEMAALAADGYEALTYDDAISVFAGSTVPVKKQGLFASKGDTGMTVALTGEATVNPKVPEAAMPFAMCKEMAHRMCIYSDADAVFAAFLACSRNESINFKYSAYLMAYYYCYEALSSIPTTTAKACAEATNGGVNQLLKNDLKDVTAFFGKTEASKKQTHNLRTGDTRTSQDQDLVNFSQYTSATDLFASWYIENYILPLHREEETTFDPMDPTQVDLTTTVVTTPAEG
ncbi:MAG: DUF3810 family protein [Oscillospiraceae bacterium]|nr:DUF3810 family protein [Oscillospiraceae bacterium]